jgi:hypothetical protein
MPKVLPDIEYSSEKYGAQVIPYIEAKSSMYRIPLYKDEYYFSNVESYVNFMKGCERAVRQNDRYKKYIYYLKNVVGLNHCQVLPDIEPDEKGKIEIEMHHGPIFTLYDYCEIMLEYFLINKRKISTFRIADAILDEHQKNHIQVVMLLSTVHEEVHNRNIFINYNQAFGDLNAFIKKYGIAMSDSLKEKLNKYIDRSMMYDSTDYGILKLNDTIVKLGG